jgi:glutamate transport system substrate-binding protein
VDALKGGQVNAVTTDNVILTGFIATNEGQFKLAGTPFTEEPYGIGLKKGDNDFREFVNKTLETSFTDGTYVKAWKDTAGKFDPADPKIPTINRY